MNSGINNISIKSVYVNEIIFESRVNAYMLGFIYLEGRFYETQYVISRQNLQKLLSVNENGIEILWRIENDFVLPHQVPVEIALFEDFGVTQVFSANEIILSASLDNEDNDLYFIENVTLTTP